MVKMKIIAKKQDFFEKISHICIGNQKGFGFDLIFNNTMNTQNLTQQKVDDCLGRMKAVHKEWNEVCMIAGNDAMKELESLTGTVIGLPRGKARVMKTEFYCHADGGQLYLHLIYIDALAGKYDKEMKRDELKRFKSLAAGTTDFETFLEEADEDLAEKLVETVRISVDWPWIIQLLDAGKVTLNDSGGVINFEF